ncbi:hypothetical protein ADK43_38130 [Streptomyces rimosus subsp. rimosus]|nr:hypothetical protein ADK43_38130 [Streptomyces rimosus subsp. rimosus]
MLRRQKIVVVPYALDGPQNDVHCALAAARGFAAARGWSTTGAVTDLVTGHPSEPALRPGWARILQALREPHGPTGVVALNRKALCDDDAVYEATVHLLTRHGAGLWLVRDETSA